MRSRCQRDNSSNNQIRNNSLIECEDPQLIRNSGTITTLPRHSYYTRYSARCSQISNSSTHIPSISSDNFSRSESHSSTSLHNLRCCPVDSCNITDNNNNNFASDSTLLDNYVANNKHCFNHRQIMSIRNTRRTNHLDPCSEPDIPGTSRFMKILIFASAIVVALMFARFLTERANVATDNDGSIKKELRNIKAEINEMKNNVEFVLQKKEESARKMANVESLLEEIKKTTQEEAKLENAKFGEAPVDTAIKDAIDIYTADKTGKADFALETSGGSIVHTRNTENLVKGGSVQLFGWTVCSGNTGARAMIQPGTLPGECWAFKGSSGNAVIKLLSKIYVNGVSLEHIARSISPTNDISTAPKEFSIWSLVSADDETGDFLGKFIYDAEGPPIQFFPIEKCSKQTQFVEIKFHSNQGNAEYTCVYRLRIHGSLNDGGK